MFNHTNEPTPPIELVTYVGGGDFKKVGEEFLRYFIDIGKLKPEEHVLDVGCGTGRMALPLTKYLAETSVYEGFDIHQPGVQWCQQNISNQYPNFRFQLVDIYNKLYNPSGKYSASEFKFPYDNKSFDFIFLTSIFTHLLPTDLENYVAEIKRVLKDEGRCFVTFFLLNQESLNLISRNRKIPLTFRYDFGDYRTQILEMPEAAVAYKEPFLEALLAKHHLKISEPIRYGSWCGRRNFLSYQDICVISHM